MVSPNNILSCCQRELENSQYDYQKIISGHVAKVWHSFSTIVSQNFEAKRGINVPKFAKFTFIRNTDMPLFTLLDPFIRKFNVHFQKPHAESQATAKDLNLSLVANCCGLNTELTKSTLEAIIEYLGKRLKHGGSACKLKVGSVGYLFLDNKSLQFKYNQSKNKMKTHKTSTIPTKSNIHIVESSFGNNNNGEPKFSKHGLDMKIVNQNTCQNDRHLKSNVKSDPVHQIKRSNSEASLKPRTSTLFLGTNPQQELQVGEVTVRSSNILPRFCLPDKCPSRVAEIAKLQAKAKENAYNRCINESTLLRDNDRQKDIELVERSNFGSVNNLKEKATKILKTKEIDGFIRKQIVEAKKKKHGESLVEESHTYLNIGEERNPCVERMKKHQLKLKLDKQVKNKNKIANQLKQLHAYEQKYFLSCVEKQSEIEKKSASGKKLEIWKSLELDWKKQKQINDIKKMVSSNIYSNITT